MPYLMTVLTVVGAVGGVLAIYDFLLKRRRKTAAGKRQAVVAVVCVVAWVACVTSALMLGPSATLASAAFALAGSLLSFAVNPAPPTRSDVINLVSSASLACTIVAFCLAQFAHASDLLILQGMQDLTEALKKAVK